MEQTSATAYPNVLVSEYLRRTGQVGSKREVAKRAEQMVAAGYQQLVRFQQPNGGFDWWGNGSPTNDVLTALAIQQFVHIGRVIEVDGRIVDRARRYLLGRQRPDGSWRATSELHGENRRHGESDLVTTAYIAWSLLEAGEKGEPVKRALGYLERHLAAASENAYALALVANALALGDPKGPRTQKALATLAGLKKADAATAKGAFIPSRSLTVTYSTGDSATVETTALAASAFLAAGTHANVTSELLAYLLSKKQPTGSFGSTQATILSLRALVLSAGAARQEGRARVALTLNGAEAGTTEITPADSDVTRMFDLGHLTRAGRNRLEVKVEGKTAAQLQVVARHYRPWRSRTAPKVAPLALELRYDRPRASVGEPLQATAEIRYSGKAPTFMVTAELGLPPGMTVDGSALDQLVQKRRIARWREHGGRLVVFLNEVRPGSTHLLHYALVPRMALKAAAPESVVYEYYTPENRAVATPAQLEVL